MILLGTICISDVSADALEGQTVLTIITPQQYPAAGESFTVTVDITGNPGLCAVQFALAYDETAMKCTSAELGDVLQGTFSATNPAGKAGAIIAAASPNPVESDGTLAEFTFEMKDVLGSCTFALTDVILSDGKKNEISAAVVGGELIKPTQQPGEQQPPIPSDPPVENPQVTHLDHGGDSDTPAQGSEQPTENAMHFSDVNEDYWGAPFIARAVEIGLFSGYPDGSFRPEADISRGEFITVLWRSAGSPEPRSASAFADVKESDFFCKAVAWAAENGYVNGVSAERFNPDGVLERQAAMSILFRYSGSQSGMELMFTGVYDSGFEDSAEIAPWAKPAMYWAYYNGIINGVSEDLLSPTTGATRAQIAKILVNYVEKFAE